jgi:uncharacterized membrane protein YciS (DUF1049 family)
MERELRAALVAAGGMALSLLFAVIAFRVVTPAVLEAHFEGSTLAATVVGFALAAGVIVFTVYWIRLVGRLLRQPDKEEKP